MKESDVTSIDALTICEAVLDQGMGVAQALSDLLTAAIEDPIRLPELVAEAKGRVRSLHALLEYNIVHLGFRRGGPDRLAEVLREQKTLPLDAVGGTP